MKHRALCLALLLLQPALLHAQGRGADGKFDKRESAHFVLLQDVAIDETGGLRGSRRFEQETLKVLEQAYDRLEALLDLRPPRKIRVLIYDPDVFDGQFAGLFRFAAAGFYSGVIRIRGATDVHDGLIRVLHHELVHAALHVASPSRQYPAWLNEGLAEWFEARSLGKRHLSGGEHEHLLRNASVEKLYSLDDLDMPSFGHLGPRAARLAYIQSYAFVEFLVRRHGERSLREIVARFIRTGDLHRTLRRVYRADLATLEQDFIAELR